MAGEVSMATSRHRQAIENHDRLIMRAYQPTRRHGAFSREIAEAEAPATS